MWNLVSSNKLCADRFTAQNHLKHVQNINTVKPSIDNAPPEIPSFLRTRAKQEKLKETEFIGIARAAVIQYENRVLLDKMMDIEKKKTSLNPEVIKQKSFHKVRSLNTNKRIKDLRKINDENKALLRRLQSAKSVYSIDKWIDSDRKNNTLKQNISQNARRAQHPDFGNVTSYSKTFYSPHSGENTVDRYQEAGMYYEY